MAGKNSNNNDSSQERVKTGANKQPFKHSKDQQRQSSIGDAGATQQEKDLAQKALSDFNAANYSQALDYLNKIEVSRPKDIKVLLNKAVCEYYTSGLVHTEAFTKMLTDTISKVSSRNGSPSHSSRGECVPECCVAVLNLAVVHYYGQQYQQALDLLKPLYEAFDSLDDRLASSVTVLLALCHLASNGADKALALLLLTQTHLREQQSDVAAPASAAAGHEDSKEDTAGLPLLRVRAFLSLRFLKRASKEYKAILTHAALENRNLEHNQICIKSQLKFLRGQYLKSLKVLNTCVALPSVSAATPSIRREWPSKEVWYYNNLALIHMGLGKPTMAMIYMDKALDHYRGDAKKKGPGSIPLYDSSRRISASLCYNMGLMLLRLRKSQEMLQMSFQYFIETLQTYPNNARLWLHLAQCSIAVHNWCSDDASWEDGHHRQAVTVRKLGRGSTAKMLLCANTPRWLCVRSSPSDAAFPEPGLPFARLCVLNALRLLQPPAGDSATDHHQQQDLAAVAACLGNDSGGEPLPPMLPCAPSLPMRAPDAERLRYAALACAAYTYLCLRDYRTALTHATQLLDATAAHHHQTAPADSSLNLSTDSVQSSGGTTHCTTPETPSLSTYRLLARLYCSECCVMLDRLSDAASHLDIAELGADSAAAVTGQRRPGADDGTSCLLGDSGSVADSNLEEQQQMMRFNLSIVYALRQDYDKALALSTQIWSEHPGSKPTALVMLSIYLHIKKGDIGRAQTLVRDHLKL